MRRLAKVTQRAQCLCCGPTGNPRLHLHSAGSRRPWALLSSFHSLRGSLFSGSSLGRVTAKFMASLPTSRAAQARCSRPRGGICHSHPLAHFPSQAEVTQLQLTTEEAEKWRPGTGQKKGQPSGWASCQSLPHSHLCTTKKN